MRNKTYKHMYHIFGKKGWVNDPNGSCYYDGKYHIFYQYSPDYPESTLKYWGHVSSEDMIHWEDNGIALKPDIPQDKDGVYSGTAFCGDGKMELFYTGNVKHQGDFDYILTGREQNVIYLSSEDGINFSEKELLMTNEDFPKSMGLHVRDPKVWKEEDKYYMFLGARSVDDKASMLIFESSDKKNWKLYKEYTPSAKLGYMFECPDYFEVDGIKAIGGCPQGMESEEFKFMNMYQSGYFILNDNTIHSTNEELEKDITVSNFKEWDMGFDFYAPQVFEARDGKKIIIGWAGVPDAPYNNAKSLEEGFEHSLTLFREISYDSAKKIFKTYPIKGYESLRQAEKEIVVADNKKHVTLDSSFDMEVCTTDSDQFKIVFGDANDNDDLIFAYEDGVCKLEFLNDTGCKRDIRRAKIDKIDDIRIFMDQSIIEIYVNKGEVVFTSRYYPNDDNIVAKFENVENVKAYSLEEI
ncbi:glycoside hydrolase family 32 protein [Lachnobacterium bovis]|uniref:glycoside hydrolase family 32 protein n=1 Tax=Lachnobacterium bovis TaxID=140626 RepID=UPI0003B76F1A|nr:glycoside hydrolase family 32 protein [Lachnobacterium bovis]